MRLKPRFLDADEALTASVLNGLKNDQCHKSLAKKFGIQSKSNVRKYKLEKLSIFTLQGHRPKIYFKRILYMLFDTKFCNFNNKVTF